MAHYHFDHNSTAPLHPVVLACLKNPPLGHDYNSSSLHHLGKKAKHLIQDATETILSSYGLKSEDWGITYHSGASEGINLALKSFWWHCREKQVAMLFCYSELDHSCVIENVRFLQGQGVECYAFPIDIHGNLDWSGEDFHFLESWKERNHQVNLFINLTRMNNEIGVVWSEADLEPLLRACEERGLSYFLHLDDVQSPGKWEGWNKIDSRVSASTYSAHKFGALKGIGMTLYRLERGHEIAGLIVGGTQQNGMRAGTINTLGVHTIGLLYRDFLPTINIEQTTSARLWFEEELLKKFSKYLRVNAMSARRRSSNTLSLTIDGAKSESLVMAFDLEGILLSQGSACASGTSKASRVLMQLGLTEGEAKRSIRISLPHECSLADVKASYAIFDKVLSRFFTFN
jgi:cysteine desulfurase